MEEPKDMEEPMTMTSICSTCLSQDRHMKPLQSIPLFKTLHWLKLDLVVSAPMVCWECEAALTRAERFRRRAARAQAALRVLELSNHQCHQQLTCLTTLSVVGPHTYTHTNYDNVIKLDQLVKNETDGFEDPVQKEGSTTIIESIKTEDENDIKHTDALMDVSSEVNSDSDTYNEKPQQPTSFSLSENGEKEREDDILEPHEQFIVDKTPAPHSIHIAESNNTTDDFVNVFFKSPPVRSYTRINRKRNGVRTLVIFKKVHNAVPTENKRIELTMPKGRSTSIDERHNSVPTENKRIELAMPKSRSTSIDERHNSVPTENKRIELAMPKGRSTSIDERHNAVPPKNKTAKLTIPNSRKYVKKDPYDFYKRLRENTDYITVIISEQEMIANIERARSNAMGSDTGKGTSEDTSQADPFQLFLSETQPPPSDPECPLCSKYFDNEEKFMEHCVDFHRTLYQCLKCSYRNFFKDNIFDHIQETHNVFLCQYCFIQLDSEIHLRNHMVENHNALIREKGPVECEQCGKIFRHPCHLREHVQIHLDKEKRRQQCPHCDKKVVLLRHHLRLFHRNNKRIETEQQCPHCDTVVMGDVKLKHHILTVHTRDPKCYCENCDKQFLNVGQYKSHLKRSRVHNPNPPKFQCQHCIKQFTSKITLHSHVEVVHELKKPFVCETCGTACGSRKHLNKHIREKHDTDKAKKPEKKKQICQYCGIECKNSTTLANHLRTHTGEKPYHCAHCDWQFRQRGPLVTHLRGMHPGRVPPRSKR